MSLPIKLLAVAVTLVVASSAAKDAEVDMKKVVDLTGRTYRKATQTGNWLIMFYAPWCGHCKRLKPIFADLSVDEVVTRGQGLSVGKVDCTVHTQTCEDEGAKGYPRIKYIIDGTSYLYESPRTKEAIKKFAVAISQPNIKEYSSAEALQEDVKKRQSKKHVTFVAHIEEGDPSNALELMNAVKLHCLSFDNFDLVAIDAIAGEESSLVVHNDGPKPEVYTGEWDMDSIKKWIEYNRFLIIEEYGINNYFSIGKTGRLMATYVYGDESKTAGMKELQAIVKSRPELRKTFAFGRLDGEEWTSWIEQFGMTRESLPVFFVYDTKMELYRWNKTLSVHGKEVKAATATMLQFLDGVLSGEEPEIAFSFEGRFNKLKRWISPSLLEIDANSQMLVFAIPTLVGGTLLGIALLFICLGADDEEPAPVNANTKKND